MAGSPRSSGGRGETAPFRVPLVLVACSLAACSSGSGTSNGSLADPSAAQSAPQNSQEAVLNGEAPLANPEQAAASSEQPPANAQGASAVGGATPASGATPTGGATITNPCNDLCSSIGAGCVPACGSFCGELSGVAAACLSAASSYIGCLTGGTLVCTGAGRLVLRGPTDCSDEFTALVRCAGVDVTSPSQNGGGATP